MLESWVWFHGFAIAVMVAKTDEWWTEMGPYQFGLGFGTLFFFTQIFGFPFWRSISPFWRIGPPLAWTIFAILIVTLQEDVRNSYLTGMITIPAGQWACALAAWLIILGMSKCMPTRYIFKLLLDIVYNPCSSIRPLGCEITSRRE